MKRLLDCIVDRLAVGLGMRIDEIVQRSRLLTRSENQVAPGRELDPVFVVAAEEVVPLLRMLLRLAAIYRNPSVALQIELGPTVVARDFGLSPLVWKRKPNG